MVEPIKIGGAGVSESTSKSSLTELLVQDFLKKLEIKQEDYEEHLKNAVTDSGETPEDFKCNICTLLVLNPVECNQCDQLFCKSCLNAWMAKGKSTCPNCRKDIMATTLNRNLKKYLDKTLLRGCPMPDCPEA
jgi:hypothetical protein